MWFDGEPFCHAHVTISGLDFISHSGHLFQADIAVTGEFFLQPLPRIERVFDEQTGLKRIK
jgi:predicted DNA-binding protein with PD1-like motif